ncbi:MAG: hypothetical protein L0220_24330 [Acidobacteria bacterium]|nr:hypothetical protein [Acidobacteriota bacterium]
MRTRILATILLLTTTLLFSACPSKTSINQINGDPERYRGKEVMVIGEVTNSYGVRGIGAYELNDGTGKLWVITDRGVPSKGAQVGAIGKYLQGVNWDGRNFGSALQETDRKVK